MKKFFFGIGLFGFLCLAITLTQVSCQKTEAQRNTLEQNPLNLVLLGKGETSTTTVPTNSVDSLGQPITKTTTVHLYDYYIINLDGTNLRKIPVSLPAGLEVVSGGHLSADGKSLVFNAITRTSSGSTQQVTSYVYSCSIDGSNLKKLAEGPYAIQDVY